MLKRAVGRENVEAVLCQIEESMSIRHEVVICLEGILVGVDFASPNHHAQQLHVHALELVDFGVRLRAPADLIGEAMPELKRDGTDLLHGQVRALQDDLQNAQDLSVRALLHDERDEALARFNVDAADLQEAVLVSLERSFRTLGHEGLELGAQVAQEREDDLDDRLEERQVHAAHPEDLYDDVGGRLTQLATFGDVLEALGNQRILGDVLGLQVRKLDPTEKTLQDLFLGLY
mmetsp:Transcript_77589/g.179910  ORF Transcript_77589/g.179910 Transcript_77589/m.179910 type:complete len:233 (-) Transcript_77589:615-1313(-)